MEHNDIQALVKSLPPVVEIEQEWIERRDKLLAESKAIIGIADNAAHERTGMQLRLIGSAVNELTKVRKRLIEPFLKVQKAVNKLADHIEDPLNIEKERLRKLMSAYELEVERRRREEIERQMAEAAARAEAEARAKAEAAAAKDDFTDDEPVMVPPPVALPIPTHRIETEAVRKTFTRTTRKWRFEVLDESQVPRNFMTPNVKKLQALADSEKEAANLPGVRFYEDLIVSAR